MANTPAPVQDDPLKPYKAIAGAVAAGIVAVITEQASNLPLWLMCVLIGLAAGLSAFVVPNPKKRQ